MSAHGSYSAPPFTITVDGLLFDFDGTIVDSTDGTSLCYASVLTNMLTIPPRIAIVKHWHKFVTLSGTRRSWLTDSRRLAEELGVDPKTILATSHGRRSIDTLALYDKSKANWDCKCGPACVCYKPRNQPAFLEPRTLCPEVASSLTLGLL